MAISKRVIGIVLAVLITAGVSVGGCWYWFNQPKVKRPPEVLNLGNSYVTVDKVIVMLRDQGAEEGDHYLAIDLAFRTFEDKKDNLNDQRPLLKSIALQTLTSLDYSAARNMTVAAFHDRLAKAYKAHYASEGLPVPFTQVLIDRLIIE